MQLPQASRVMLIPVPTIAVCSQLVCWEAVILPRLNELFRLGSIFVIAFPFDVLTDIGSLTFRRICPSHFN